MKFKYIQFVMKPSLDARVKYVTELQEGDRPLSLPYDKFLSFLYTHFKINDKEGLLTELNSHSIIYLDNDTGEFTCESIYKDAFNADFKTLTELNTPKEETNIYDSTIAKSRNLVNNFKHAIRNPYTKRRDI